MQNIFINFTLIKTKWMMNWPAGNKSQYRNPQIKAFLEDEVKKIESCLFCSLNPVNLY